MSRFHNGFFFYSITLLLSFCKLDYKKEIYLNYFHTSETVYTRIEIKNKKLYHTYFDSNTKDCAQWVAQVPCWNVKDLKTDSLIMDDRVYEKLSVLIDSLIKADQKNQIIIVSHPQNRHYTYQLEIKKDNFNKTIMWYRYPGARQVEKEVNEIVVYLTKILNP